MSDNKAVAVIGEMGIAALEQAKQQVQLIQHLMKDLMIKDQHYGTVPGCGPKQVLLKAGAEKLCLTFGLRMVIDPNRDIVVKEYDNFHKEYRVTCHLFNKAGEEVATGVGLCSTMEGKYAFRTTWVNEVKKKAPNDNIQDTYNTVLKMAKKRAHVDAAITACAASDIFTQDIEEMSGIDQRDAAEAEVLSKAKHTEPEPKKEGRANERIPSLAIMEYSLIDKMETGEDRETGKMAAKVVFGDITMYCFDEEVIKGLAVAHKAKQRVKVQFDNLARVKKLMAFKVEGK